MPQIKVTMVGDSTQLQAATARSEAAVAKMATSIQVDSSRAGKAAAELAKQAGASADEQAAAAGRAAAAYASAAAKITTAQDAAAKAAVNAAKAAGASADAQVAAAKRAMAAQAELESGIVASQSRMSKLSGATTSILGVSGKTAGAAAAGFSVYEAVKMAGDYQDSVSRIAASTGVARSEAEKVGQAFLDTAGETEHSGRQMADAYAAVAAQLKTVEGAALNAAQAQHFMLAAGDLATGTETDLGTATNALAAVMQAYGIKARAAGQASDVLYNTSHALNAPLSTLATTVDRLHSRLGDTAPSLLDVSGLMLDLGEHGVQGSRGAPTAANALTNLLGGSKDVKYYLDALGVSLYDSNGKFVGLQSVIEQLGPALDKMNDKTKNQAEDTLFGTSAAKLMGQVLQDGIGTYNKATDAVSKLGTAHKATKEAEENGLGPAKVFRAAIDNLGTDLGNQVLPVLTTFIDLTDDAVQGWVQMTSSWDNAMYDMAKVTDDVLNHSIIPALQGLADAYNNTVGLIPGVKDLKVPSSDLADQVVSKVQKDQSAANQPSIQANILDKMTLGGGGSSQSKIEKFFENQGYSKAAIAGILGNLKAEDPNLNPTTPEVGGGGGYGIAQFTGRTRAQLEAFAKTTGGVASSLATQLLFLQSQISASPSLKAALAGAKTPAQAAEIFETQYERPKVNNTAYRQQLANEVAGIKGASGTGTGNIPSPSDAAAAERAREKAQSVADAAKTKIGTTDTAFESAARGYSTKAASETNKPVRDIERQAEQLMKNLEGTFDRVSKGQTGKQLQATVDKWRSTMADFKSIMDSSVQSQKNANAAAKKEAEQRAKQQQDLVKRGQSTLSSLSGMSLPDEVALTQSGHAGYQGSTFSQHIGQSKQNYSFNALVTQLQNSGQTGLANQLLAAYTAAQKDESNEITAQAKQAYATWLTDQQTISTDAANKQVAEINAATQDITDSFAIAAERITEATQAMADATNAQVQAIGDKSKIDTDTLAERGLYGYALQAQQQQVALDKTVANDDAVTAQKQQALDDAQAMQLQVLQQQQAYDQANANAQIAELNAQADIDRTKAKWDTAIGTLQQKVAQGTATQSALDLLQGQATVAIAQAQGSLADVESAGATAVATANQALANAQGQANTAIAQAQQALQNAQDITNLDQAQGNAIIDAIKAEGAAFGGAGGLVVNLYGVDPNNVSGIRSEFDWLARTGYRVPVAA